MASNLKQMSPKSSNIAKVLMALAIILFIVVSISIMLKVRQDFSLKPVIAVIPVHGEIGINSEADPIAITKLIQKADKELTVRAIIIDINSPGGSAVGSKQIADAIKLAEKPTVALIREVGASGALWIATSADRVVADPVSITGSIGVTASYVSFENLMQKYGITYNRLVTGELKDAGTPYKELTPQEREYIMKKITIIKDIFVQAIAENRNLPVKTVSELADGGIWLGSEAQAYGIVDILGGEKEAQKTAEQLAGITESRLLRLEEKRPPLFELLSGGTNSIAYWIGKGIAATFIEASNNQRMPQMDV
ncbi:MAG: signal peptide peptidase SppA [Candidatus Nanoarchaeia archaeon]